MIIGHLPAGYICSRLIFPRLQRFGVSSRGLIVAGMSGALAPDLDVVYFYVMDHRQHYLHSYWPRFPVVWLGLLITSALWLGVGPRKTGRVALVFSLNGVLHMLLDTVAAKMWWFEPFSDQSFALFTVPVVMKPWWLSFIFHWSFSFVLGLVLWAFALWKRDRGDALTQGWADLVCQR